MNTALKKQKNAIAMATETLELPCGDKIPMVGK
jgi:hypothetical protein